MTIGGHEFTAIFDEMRGISQPDFLASPTLILRVGFLYEQYLALL